MRILILMIIAALLSGCGYNQIQQKDESVKAAWSQVLNVYKRRADLVPNLVATVKGYASHEERVFTEVTNARAKVGSININADDPASLAQFQQAQGELQSAIGRLLVVSENYPQLKADQNFLQLQAQLEGTENRITVERQRYIQTVQDYNTYIRQFPVNLTCDDVRLQAQAELHGRERSADPAAADGGFRTAGRAAATGPAATACATTRAGRRLMTVDRSSVDRC
jgi:LemA protein